MSSFSTTASLPAVHDFPLLAVSITVEDRRAVLEETVGGCEPVIGTPEDSCPGFRGGEIVVALTFKGRGRAFVFGVASDVFVVKVSNARDTGGVLHAVDLLCCF